MTKLLELAIEAARQLPPDEQDEIARTIMEFTGAESAPVPLTPDERAAVGRSKAAAARGDFASEDEVRGVWAKHGL
jgi:hypothetical protein